MSTQQNQQRVQQQQNNNQTNDYNRQDLNLGNQSSNQRINRERSQHNGNTRQNQNSQSEQNLQNHVIQGMQGGEGLQTMLHQQQMHRNRMGTGGHSINMSTSNLYHSQSNLNNNHFYPRRNNHFDQSQYSDTNQNYCHYQSYGGQARQNQQLNNQMRMSRGTRQYGSNRGNYNQGRGRGMSLPQPISQNWSQSGSHHYHDINQAPPLQMHTNYQMDSNQMQQPHYIHNTNEMNENNRDFQNRRGNGNNRAGSSNTDDFQSNQRGRRRVLHFRGGAVSVVPQDYNPEQISTSYDQQQRMIQYSDSMSSSHHMNSRQQIPIHQNNHQISQQIQQSNQSQQNNSNNNRNDIENNGNTQSLNSQIANRIQNQQQIQFASNNQQSNNEYRNYNQRNSYYSNNRNSNQNSSSNNMQQQRYSNLQQQSRGGDNQRGSKSGIRSQNNIINQPQDHMYRGDNNRQPNLGGLINNANEQQFEDYYDEYAPHSTQHHSYSNDNQFYNHNNSFDQHILQQTDQNYIRHSNQSAGQEHMQPYMQQQSQMQISSQQPQYMNNNNYDFSSQNQSREQIQNTNSNQDNEDSEKTMHHIYQRSRGRGMQRGNKSNSHNPSSGISNHPQNYNNLNRYQIQNHQQINDNPQSNSKLISGEIERQNATHQQQMFRNHSHNIMHQNNFFQMENQNMFNDNLSNDFFEHRSYDNYDQYDGHVDNNSYQQAFNNRYNNQNNIQINNNQIIQNPQPIRQQNHQIQQEDRGQRHTVHRRRYGTGNNNVNDNEDEQISDSRGNNDQIDDSQREQQINNNNSNQHHQQFIETQPLTKASRVLRRGRGVRNDFRDDQRNMQQHNPNDPNQQNEQDLHNFDIDNLEQNDIYDPHDDLRYEASNTDQDRSSGSQNRIDNTHNEGEQYKIVQRSGGRGQRGGMIRRHPQNNFGDDNNGMLKQYSQDIYNSEEYHYQQENVQNLEFKPQFNNNQYMYHHQSQANQYRPNNSINHKNANNQFQNTKIKHFNYNRNDNNNFQRNSQGNGVQNFRNNQQYQNQDFRHQQLNQNANQDLNQQSQYDNVNEQKLKQSQRSHVSQYSSQPRQAYVPEYERYGDYNDDGYSKQVYSNQSQKPTQNVKYRLKTFDDENDSADRSLDDNDSNGGSEHKHVRRGPKLIKFKQKKPDERLPLSQLKQEQDEKTENLDLYTPQNSQTNTSQIQILKHYKDFELPEFFQGPQWKFIRQSTNQNSKQKHYDKGDYDKVQFNFPGAELEDKETDGEQKLYPPIDDFSDEDVGIAPSSTNLRAKISFNKSAQQSNEEQKSNTDQSSSKEQTSSTQQTSTNQQINIMQSTFELAKNQKTKRPAVQNKAFTFDQKKDKSNGSNHSSKECLLIQGLPSQEPKEKDVPMKRDASNLQEGAVTIEVAEQFFVKEQDQIIQERKNKTNFFDKYLTDKAEIDEKLKKGLLWKGLLRVNPKFRHRAYASIEELNIDILVEGQKLMNRAFDGDTVIIELLPVHSWNEIADQNSIQAKITTLCHSTGLVQKGINHLRQMNIDDQAYTNENAIEERTIDKLPQSQVPTWQIPNKGANDVLQWQQQDKLSMSLSQSEDDQGKNMKGNPIILSKLRPKKLMKALNNEEHEGYIASNSDNNIERKNTKDKKRLQINPQCNLRKDSQQDQTEKNENDSKNESPNVIHKLSSSFSERLDQASNDDAVSIKSNDSKSNINMVIPNEEKNQDLWEHLELVGLQGQIGRNIINDEDQNQNNQQQNQRDLSNQQMTMAHFIGQDNLQTATVKQSSYNRIELNGERDDITSQINEYGKTLRPLGRVVAVTDSPNRECEQMVTMVEILKELQLIQTSSIMHSQDNYESIIFAVPINDKLPWFIVSTPPPEFIADKDKGRHPSHRYYVIKYQDWKTTQKRPHCDVVESIGEAGNLKAESIRLLRMHEICTESYGQEGQEATSHVHECLKVFTKDIDEETKEWKIPEEEIQKRLDLRDKPIFTIDPITAKDLDDALSIEMITDQIYEIGVHVADVSYFVQQGSDLDAEAQKRCTSTYFVHEVYPMLPKLLCEKLCSLNPNVDRLAYSIFFRMNISNGELMRDFQPVIKRSVIKSKAKWNYELAQKIIKGTLTDESQLEEEMKPIGATFLDIAQDILTMNTIAQQRRKNRMRDGSLQFDNKEFNFTLNKETQYPIKYSESPRMESKQLVEEYMLLANILIGEHLYKHCQDKTLLRAHREIEQDKKDNLSEFFQKIGLDSVDVSDPLLLSQSLEKLRQEDNSEDKLRVINHKFLDNIKMARYVCVESRDPSEFYHYGLNFPIYTHFTSPIRRYADLLVHRLLTIALKEKENTRAKIDGLDYAEFADLISDKSLSSRHASRDCTTLFHCLLLKEHGSRVYNALIFDIESHQISVYLEELNIHLRIKLRDDLRIDQTTYFDQTVQVACSFKTPLLLAPYVKVYQGNQELNKTNQQKKKEEEIRRMEEESRDLIRRLQKSLSQQSHNERSSDQIMSPLIKDHLDPLAQHQEKQDEQLRQNMQTNCLLSVMDRVKILVEASANYPMEIKSELLITVDDMEEYERVLAAQTEKLEQMDELVKDNFTGDGTILRTH